MAAVSELQRLDDFGPAATYRHGRLFLICSLDVMGLEEAHAHMFGVNRWRHISVSVAGQRALATWDDLTHLVYSHDLGFDQKRDVLQFLPPPSTYVNVAEALHLWQPA